MRPDDVVARFALAGVYVSPGKNEEARQLLEAVVAAEPKYVEACAHARDRLLPAAAQADGDRMRTRVEELNAEAQARQPGSAGRRSQPRSR